MDLTAALHCNHMKLDAALKIIATTADFTANDVYELVKLSHSQLLEVIQSIRKEADA